MRELVKQLYWIIVIGIVVGILVGISLFQWTQTPIGCLFMTLVVAIGFVIGWMFNTIYTLRSNKNAEPN